jgi:hypothetical protein
MKKETKKWLVRILAVVLALLFVATLLIQPLSTLLS